MSVSERRQRQHDQAVAFIVRLVDERGYPPSVRELAAHLGLQSIGTTHRLLVEMEQAGRIRRGDRFSSRAITVVEQGK